MHTLVKAVTEGYWDVIFIGFSATFVIEANLKYHIAIKLVNYLNGGVGQGFQEPLVIFINNA